MRSDAPPPSEPPTSGVLVVGGLYMDVKLEVST